MEHYNPNGGGTIPSFRNLVEIEQNPLEAALNYQRRRFVVTPLCGKQPILGRWQERILSEAELRYYFVDERNVGIVLGGPIGIVDVDLDNPLAIAVSDFLLPDTIQSGRQKSLWSHYWYLCNPVPSTKKYTLPKFMAARLMV